MKRMKKTALLGLLVTQALILQIIEGMLPSITIVPWLKLGLANIITIIAIAFFGFREVVIIVLLRTLLGALLRGAAGFFLFSFSGGILSAVVMYFMHKKYGNYFSIIGISIVGALMFNLGQLIIASVIISEIGIFSYFPLLLIVSAVAGYFIGIVSQLIIKVIKKNERYFL